jgi:hypothetical protein
MTTKTRKAISVINGYKPDDGVIVLGSTPKGNRSMVVRRVGVAGFYVKGLATCFYWHEKGRTWDEERRA